SPRGRRRFSVAGRSGDDLLRPHPPRGRHLRLRGLALRGDRHGPAPRGQGPCHARGRRHRGGRGKNRRLTVPSRARPAPRLLPPISPRSNPAPSPRGPCPGDDSVPDSGVQSPQPKESVMSGLKIPLEDAELDAVKRYAQTLGVSPADVAYAALNRLMMQAREPEVRTDIVETSRWRRQNLPLWSDSAQSVHAYEGRAADDPEPSRRL